MDHVAQKVIGNSEDARSLNHYLKSLELQAFNAHKELMELKIPLTAQNLKTKLFGTLEKKFSLIDVFKDHNKQLAALVEKEYAPATIKRYDTALRHVDNFLKWKYDAKDIDIKEIDHGFITSFDFYLRSVRNCNNNSTFKYIKNFKKIIGICLANGWLTNNPFIKYKIKIKEVTRIVLTEEELEIGKLVAKKLYKYKARNYPRRFFILLLYRVILYRCKEVKKKYDM